LTITLILHCLLVGGHEKQNDSEKTATSLSASASAVLADWKCAPP
jgi:hypothetical protein